MNTSQAVGVVSLITLFSKITGFAREMTIARGYGAGVATDAYRVALGIPNLFFTCVGAALATVLIPLFTQNLGIGGRIRAFSFTRKLTTITLIVTGAISLAGAVAAPSIVRVFAPGFRGDAYTLSVELTRVLFPGLLFTGLAFLAAGTLQSLGQFAIPALMSLPMNFLIMGAVPAFGSRFGIRVLAWATLIGIAFQFIVQWPSLRRSGYRFHWDLDLKDSAIRQTGALISPVVLGTALLQINTLVDRMFASSLAAGSISVLDYCNKLTGLVAGMVITAVATVVLPRFSQLAASPERGQLAAKVGQAIGSLNALIIPMASGLMLLRIPIVRFVYERGAFAPETTRLTATALLFAGMGLVGWGIREVATRAFYALKDTVTPMVNGVVAMLVNIALLFLFVGQFHWGVGGMALATSCSMTFSGALLTVLLRRKLGGIGLRSILGSLWKSILAAGAMATVLWRLHPLVAAAIRGGGFLAQALEMLVTIGAGGIVYVLGLTVLRAKEAQYGWATVRRIGAGLASRRFGEGRWDSKKHCIFPPQRRNRGRRGRGA